MKLYNLRFKLQKILLIITYILLPPYFFGQEKIDTIIMRQKDCGNKMNIYLWSLIPERRPKSFSYTNNTNQDKKFFDSLNNCYLIFKDSNERTIFEGLTKYGWFEGAVTYYYESGIIKRIENYGYNSNIDSNITFEWRDIPYKNGQWKYFNKKGVCYKEIIYKTVSSELNNEQLFYRIKIKTLYNFKKEKIRWTRTKTIDFTSY